MVLSNDYRGKKRSFAARRAPYIPIAKARGFTAHLITIIEWSIAFLLDELHSVDVHPLFSLRNKGIAIRTANTEAMIPATSGLGNPD